ncbi:uncharacterized protein LOC130710548 [Lotus japonicus]|uniref:uncharacterized protein LOC130710548 n=1 Tax=Lotus japonicus TaxID=34305 RepID=UPI00258D435C|nr:uncharacterized protein LOC130710548 [Lotus japonicus]
MVLLSGPWCFNRFSVVLEVLDINVHPTRVPLMRLPFWVHVFELPYNCWSEAVAKALASAFAGYITWDRRNNMRLGAYFRMEVWVDITIPLMRGQALASEDGGQMEVFFQYERLHNHCYLCGFMDHVAKDYDKEPLAEEAVAPYSGLRADDKPGDFEDSSRGRNRNRGHGGRYAEGSKPAYNNTRGRDDMAEGFGGYDADIEDLEFDYAGNDAELFDNKSNDKRTYKKKESQSETNSKKKQHGDDGHEESDSSFPVNDIHMQRKRLRASSSAPDRTGTGATPPLKKQNSEIGLGSADAAGQHRPPQ